MISFNRMTNLALMWTAMTVIVLITISPINFIVLRSWGVDIKGTPSPDTMQGTATARYYPPVGDFPAGV